MLGHPATMCGWRTLGLSLRGPRRYVCPTTAARARSSPSAGAAPTSVANGPFRLARCYVAKHNASWMSPAGSFLAFCVYRPGTSWSLSRCHSQGGTGQTLGHEGQATDHREDALASGVESQLSIELLPKEVQGMVITAKANYVQVEVETDWRSSVPHPLLLCNVKTLLKKMKQHVLVGDQVVIESIDWQDGRGFVGKVLPRSSELADPTIANTDHVLLVFAADDPPFDITQVTRFLVGSEVHDIPITVVLNKCDLLSPAEVQLRVDQLQEWGYSAVPISVHASVGLEELAETMRGKMTVLAGPSGVGKSSVINYIRTKSTRMGSQEHLKEASSFLEEDLQRAAEQRVGTVGKTGRGRHTTRHTTLLMLPNGGIVADTPGFNQPSLDTLKPEDVPSCFPEVRERLRGNVSCTFNDCRHLQEPGCVARGDWERYPLYVDLLLEVEDKDALLRERAQSKELRQGRVRYKSGSGGEARQEVLLDSKKHRRKSRKQTKQKFMQDILGGEFTDHD